MKFASRLSPALPEGIAPARFFAYLTGPALLAAGAGIQLVLALILLTEPPARDPDRLTDWGRMFFVPEREVEIYVAGVLGTLGLCVFLAWIWGALLRSTGRRLPLPGRVVLAARAGFAVLAILAFMAAWTGARAEVVAGNDVPAGQLGALLTIVLVTLAAAFPLELMFTGKSRADPRSGAGREEPEPRRALKFSVLDALVPLLVFVLVYIPAWRQLAGDLFVADAFFHWDYYAMGPALAFSHGEALGTDVYAMYGAGWPAVFGMLGGISYGRMLQLSTLYAVLYFSGVYLLLRLLVRRPAIAAAGTVLAMSQLFLGMAEAVVWVLPSLTVLRWAFDVWFFAALVQHRNSRRPVWALVAGAAAGAALVFSTDTGLYLAAAGAFYWLCSAWGEREAGMRARDAAAAAAGALVVLAAGLGAAARGRIFNGEFWAGWLEPLGDYRGGFAQVPFQAGPSAFTVACFTFLAVLYLAVAGRCLAKVLYRRAASTDLLTGMFAVYGLMNLLHFVGRSVDGTLPRLILPLVFLAAAACSGADRARLRIGMASVALVLVSGLFLAPSSVLLDPLRVYPSLAARALGGGQPDGLCLIEEPKDVCGLPPAFAVTVERFQAVAGRLSALERQGRSVAIVDESGSILYLASGQKPFGRYPRMFLNLYSTENLKRVLDALAGDGPDYVLTRKALEASNPEFETLAYFGIGPRSDTPYPDAWEQLLGEVRSGYMLEEELGLWELWSRRPSPGP